ncbi:phosphonate ABC transporter permease [Methylobacterium sp. Leaf87]|uniref:phosphonate ABC transporter, permease protein PhnE n=1 Tax=Methylobacterium sp. Leaf87 TaxID=1736243 RepID=UPI0006F97035|nr:phosphonate ABC transporter, permease protein PhnE [Methylobacterium sp. Leaf87]KQO59026.1 phosphonate ABC transporter permease [Methylobacterium sp. Leaf87]
MRSSAPKSRPAFAQEIARIRASYPERFTNRARSLKLALCLGGGALLTGLAMWWLDFSLVRIANGLGRLADFSLMMFPPSTGDRLGLYLQALFETLAIAFLGTLVAALLAFPIAFLAAKNVVPNFFVHFGARRLLDVIRGIDTLIWALLWVSVVGLGPFAGVLAIACSDFGALGKLFSEAIETADRRPVEGVASSGGSRLQQVRFGILPQVVPVIGGQCLYYFESNTRSATIIGIVGAGGIGVHLAEQIRVLNLQDVSFLVLMILAAVTLIDVASSKLRASLIGRRPIPLG